MRSSHGDGSETIRRARPDDIEPILTLLTEYELPRSSFEPFYMHDTIVRNTPGSLNNRGGCSLTYASMIAGYALARPNCISPVSAMSSRPGTRADMDTSGGSWPPYCPYSSRKAMPTHCCGRTSPASTAALDGCPSSKKWCGLCCILLSRVLYGLDPPNNRSCLRSYTCTMW